jgi:TolB protein
MKKKSFMDNFLSKFGRNRIRIGVLGLFILVSLNGCATIGGFIGSLFKPKVADSISFDPATLRNVMRVSDDKMWKDHVVLSPDGRKLLYTEKDGNSFKIMLLKDISIFAKTPIVNDSGYYPSWFGDSESFVYVTLDGGSSKLVRSNISGGGKVYITRNPIGKSDYNPAEQDGIIICDTEINGKNQLVSLKTNGSDITILGEGQRPSWHPTLPKVVFIRDGAIWEMDSNTTQVTQIYVDRRDGVTLACDSPSYSKDGKYIVFSKKSPVANTKTRYNHLFRINADGSNLTQLTEGMVNAFSPSWGPNNTIYFISDAGGFNEIWTATILIE